MIEVTCPNCGKDLEVDDRYAGVSGKCIHCQAPIVIPKLAIQKPSKEKKQFTPIQWGFGIGCGCLLVILLPMVFMWVLSAIMIGLGEGYTQ